jgi:probable rRNA maturation factor
MTGMKKHPFLHVDFASTVALTPALKRKLDLWFDLSSEVLESVVKKGLLKKAKIKSVRVSLLLCGDSRIKKLNHEYRGKNKVTDVLSFPSFESLRDSDLQQEIQNGELFLGDLAICHPQAIRQAKEFNVGYLDEVIHLFFHGMIHLMGYDHELSEAEEKVMEEWEQKALKKFSEVKKKRGAK